MPAADLPFFSLYTHGFARVAVGIPSVRVADPSANAERTLALARRAASEVVAAMGHPELASCSLRISLPWNATADDAHRFATAYVQMAGRLSRQAA